MPAVAFDKNLAKHLCSGLSPSAKSNPNQSLYPHFHSKRQFLTQSLTFISISSTQTNAPHFLKARAGSIAPDL